LLPYISPEQISAEWARRKHLEFMRYCWQRPFDELTPGRHTIAICDRIDKAILDFQNKKSTFLAVQVPIGHGKSDICTRYLPANFIGKFPDHPIIATGYSSDLVEGFSRDCQNIIRDDRFRQIYPGRHLSKKLQSAARWGLDGYFGVTTWVGLGGSITGKRGALIVCDDFYKGREEADSLTIRDSRWDAFTNDLMTRFAPTVIVIVLATPWHVDDIFGRIAEKMANDTSFPNFEFMKFPAFSDEYPTGTLFPERYKREWYDGQAAVLGQYGTASLLQCNPVIREGALFKIDNVQFYEDPPEDVVWARGWDLASTKKERVTDDPDYTVGIKLGVRWQKSSVAGQYIPTLYVDDMVRGQWDAPVRDKHIKNTAIDDGPISVGVEAFGPYRDAYTTICDALFGLRIVKKINLPGDKITKWAPIETAFESGNVFIRRAGWNSQFIAEMGLIPGGRHDDIADAMRVAYELHHPTTKRVFQSFSVMDCRKESIDWDNNGGSGDHINIGSVYMTKDLAVSWLAAIWDQRKFVLYVYDCDSWDIIDVNKVASEIITRMHVNTHKLKKIVGCDLMFSPEQEAQVRSVNAMFKEECKRRHLNQGVYISKPILYDQIGSIEQANRLFASKRIVVSSDCHEAARQFSNWVIERGKPSVRDSGMCEALCLIVSELRRKKIFVKEPKIRDYHSSEGDD
jgi:predicted phage terminase large subunit-like protein